MAGKRRIAIRKPLKHPGKLRRETAAPVTEKVPPAPLAPGLINRG